MRTITAVVLCVFVVSGTMGEVRPKVYLADGITLLPPIDPNDPNHPYAYPDIMVGTKLVIIIDSNFAEDWPGALIIEDVNIDYGVLSARDYDGFGYPGSCLPAAGEGATVYDWEEAGIDGFGLGTGFMDIEAGDWFIIDYTATNIGNCNVSLYESHPPFGEDILINYLELTHVPSRDFDKSTKVDFGDFAVFASYWMVSSCKAPDWCDGADLDRNHDVDGDDLAMFADYWLERTE